MVSPRSTGAPPGLTFRSDRSWPAQKPRPAPVSTTARQPSSASIAANAARSATCISTLKLLSRSGRFSVSRVTPPCRSTRTVSPAMHASRPMCCRAIISRAAGRVEPDAKHRTAMTRDPDTTTTKRESRVSHLDPAYPSFRPRNPVASTYSSALSARLAGGLTWRTVAKSRFRRLEQLALGAALEHLATGTCRRAPAPRTANSAAASASAMMRR